MKKIFKLSIAALMMALLTFGCDGSYDSLVNEQKDENPTPEPIQAESGSADFSRYVAIGNSLTAGLMDAALYDLGQQNSMAALISTQLSFAGGADMFYQPDINSTLGFNISVANPNDQFGILGRFKLDPALPGPSAVLGGEMITAFTGDKSRLGNFGVPGLGVRQLLSVETGIPGSGLFNPFYARFASSPGSSTVLGDAIATDPTFFTFWVGSNDVLGFALSGATSGAGMISASQFESEYNLAINTLMAETQAQGVVADIPSVLNVPFFRVIPYNVIVLTQEQADQLNSALADGFNQILDGLADQGLEPQDDMDRRKLSFSAGPNPVMIRDPELKNLAGRLQLLVSFGVITAEQREALLPYVQARQMTSSELVLLSASSVLGQPPAGAPTAPPVGVGFPLEPQFHLTDSNIDFIETRRAEYNSAIHTSVNAQTRIALYNVEAPGGIWNRLFGNPGVNISGTTLMPDFTPAGVFSTDAVHPNIRGNALIANEFLGVIEAAFGATLPKVDVLNLPSVQLCTGDCVSQQSGAMMNMDFSNVPYSF